MYNGRNNIYWSHVNAYDWNMQQTITSLQYPYPLGGRRRGEVAGALVAIVVYDKS